MFVVLITRGYPSARHLQNGNFEATQAQALSRLGHKVIVIGVNCYSIKNYDIIGSHHRYEAGIEIYEDYSLAFPSHNRMPFIVKSWILSIKINRILRRIIKQHGVPDIIHSHYLLMTSAVGRIIDRFKIPLICTEHWSQINSNNLSKSVIDEGKAAYQKAARILAVSDQTKKSILTKFGFEAETMYNMVDNRYFNNIEFNEENCEFSFISIGEMSDNRKGFDILLKAFAKYIQSGEDDRLYLRGHGLLKPEYELLAKNLGIYDKVTFIPEVSLETLANYISKSNVVVMSSRIETFGVVLIEGMAKGKPVIATKCGGPEDFITPEMGILINPESVEELCDAMIQMKNNYDQYDREYIRNLCFDNYSQESIAKKITKIYETVVND